AILLVFFFSSRRRHTRFSRDWSSDVCSSDLPAAVSDVPASISAQATSPTPESTPAAVEPEPAVVEPEPAPVLDQQPEPVQPPAQIGRASCRERVEARGLCGGVEDGKDRTYSD